MPALDVDLFSVYLPRAKPRTAPRALIKTDELMLSPSHLLERAKYRAFNTPLWHGRDL